MPSTAAFSDLSRRHFVRTLLLGSASSMVVNQGWQGSLVAAITPQAVEGPGRLFLRVADYPPLGQAFGAVRIGFASLNTVNAVRPIIVTKDDDAYFAVTSECTHMSCIIPPFAANKTSTCPCHGSRYAPDGSVLRGPASSSLPSYTVTSDGAGTLVVEIPEFPAYDVTVGQVLSAGVSRVTLDFLALRNIEYEVRTRAALDQPGEVRPFATTEMGPATSTVFRGTGVVAKLYVERSGDAGFIAVAAKARVV